MGIIIVWLVLFVLIILSFFTQKVSLWVPLLLYVVAVSVRVKEKMGNYIDWQRINKRDEKLKLEEIAEDMANRGLTFSGIRTEAEKKTKEDFEFERKKQKRKFWVELVDSLFLK